MQLAMLAWIPLLILAAPMPEGEAASPLQTQTSQVQTSAEALRAAKERLSTQREALGLTSISTRVGESVLVVTAPAWEEAGRQAVLAVAGILDILFEIYNGTAIDNSYLAQGR